MIGDIQLNIIYILNNRMVNLKKKHLDKYIYIAILEFDFGWSVRLNQKSRFFTRMHWFRVSGLCIYIHTLLL